MEIWDSINTAETGVKTRQITRWGARFLLDICMEIRNVVVASQ